MNKRIRKLSDIAYENYLARNPNSSFSRCTDYDREFAELIVRECDRYVAEQYDELEPWMQPGDLLKHFGVEENEQPLV